MRSSRLIKFFYPNDGLIIVGIILFLLMMLMAFLTHAQELFTAPLKTNPAYKSGEVLTYQMKYGLIVGGTTTLSLSDSIYNDKTVLFGAATAETTGIANVVYEVKDIYQSWFNADNNLPYKQSRDIHEGRYTQYNEVTYNRKKNTVNSKLSGIHEVPAKIMDLVSTFYYLRRVDFSKINAGDEITVNMFLADETTPFHLKYTGKEVIRTKFGKIRCIKISPQVIVGRMFKKKDDLTIWFTDDENCLPILVEVDIRVVGKVLLKLNNYENTISPLLLEME